MPPQLDRQGLALVRRHEHVEIARLRRDAVDRPALAPEVAADHAHARAVIVDDLGDLDRRDVLIARSRHLERGGQVGPQLEAVHAPLRVALRHFLMQDAAAGGHPLHVACAHLTLVAEAVAVLDGAGEHIGDGLDAAVRMPGKAGAVVIGVVVAEIIEQQERVELAGRAEAEGTAQLHAGALGREGRLRDALDGSN